MEISSFFGDAFYGGFHFMGVTLHPVVTGLMTGQAARVFGDAAGSRRNKMPLRVASAKHSASNGGGLGL